MKKYTIKKVKREAEKKNIKKIFDILMNDPILKVFKEQMIRSSKLKNRICLRLIRKMYQYKFLYRRSRGLGCGICFPIEIKGRNNYGI